MRDDVLILLILPILALSVLLAAFLAHGAHALQRAFRDEIQKGLRRTGASPRGVVTEDDLKALPPLVQNYLRRTGAVGQARTDSILAVSRIDMDLGAGRGRAVMKAVEYNTFDEALTRAVLMTFRAGPLPMVGMDSYIEGRGRMQMKPFGLLPVVDAHGQHMDDSSALAMLLLNMCIAAPSSLLDPRLTWRSTSAQQLQVTLQDGRLRVSARLDFNDDGDIVRFTTEDKFYSPTGGTYEQVTWTTPVLDYREIGALRLPTRGEATWRFPAGDSVYGRLNLERIAWNPKSDADGIVLPPASA